MKCLIKRSINNYAIETNTGLQFLTRNTRSTWCSLLHDRKRFQPHLTSLTEWICDELGVSVYLGISQITSSQPLMLLLAIVVYVLLTWTISLCLAADLAHTAAGLFIMLARQSGTHCQMNLEILTASIVLNGFWKQYSLAATSVTSALQVIF